MRIPAVEGKFYPRNKDTLKEEINRCFDNLSLTEKKILGAVVPHAGYIYSGNTAAYVYSKLPHADTFVILGPNHSGYGSPVSVSVEDWKTSLGNVSTDTEFIKALPKRIIDIDENAHKYEHSIEVQIPFLMMRFSDFKIVPICVGMQDEETAIEVGIEIFEAIKKVNKKVVILASSDFSHYIPHEKAYKNDSYFIEPILSMNVSEFYNRLYERNASVCGYGCIGAMMTAVKMLGAKKGSLLKYTTSGETSGDYSFVVGYAGIIFEKYDFQ